MNTIDLKKKIKNFKSQKKAFNRLQDLLSMSLMNTKINTQAQKKTKKNQTNKKNRHFERKGGSNKVFRYFLSLIYLSLEYTHYDFFFFFLFWENPFKEMDQ